MSWELHYSNCLPPARTREVSFWWRDCLKLLPTFKHLAECDFMQGNSILLWQDKWGAHTLKETWPHLYSFCKDEHISIKQALLTNDLADLFYLPLSEEALQQFHLFNAMLLNLEPSAAFDTWTVFGNSMVTKTSTVYKSLMDVGGTIQALKWMWKSCCQQKHKVFFWLLIHNRLNTRAMLQRKNFFMDNYSCIMCDQDELETRNHMFFQCPFAQMCWRYISPTWIPPQHTDIQSFITSLKLSLNVPFFMELIMLITWAIWTTRNAFIFKQTTPNLYRCRRKFKEEASLLLHKAHRKSYAGLKLWVERFQ
jgi:hypothetical protein